MRRFAPTLVVLLLVGCSPPLRHPETEQTRFAGFIKSYLSRATGATAEDVPHMRLTARGDSLLIASGEEYLSRLRTIDTTKLAPGDRIDWLILEANIGRTLRDTLLRAAEKVPGRYVTLGSLEWMVRAAVPPISPESPEESQESQESNERQWRSILRTVTLAPSALTIGKERLNAPPPIWITLAVGAVSRHEEYLRTDFMTEVERHAPESQRDSLREAAALCSQALSDYRSFLEDSLGPGDEASWAVGEEYYNSLLEEYHFLPYTVESMIAAGWEVHRQTKRELEKLAERTGSGLSWRDAIGRMKLHHPQPGRITEAYIGESDRARRLIVDRGMLAIPPAETLLFVPTPPALRETYAWGGYGGIEMRDSLMAGRFFVTDVDAGMSPTQVEEKLRTQNDGWITVIALHEGYPGHHLQAVYSRLNPQPVRSRFGSTYYGEGWALYCESWMAREGFYVDRWDSLGWLNMRLWRTARVIIDPSLHTGKMTYEQAVRFFIDEVGLERSAAEAEVNRYTTWPTQAPSYIIGWLELESMKKDLRERFGPGVTDRAFAEAVLRSGSLPPALLRRALTESWEGRRAAGLLHE